MQFPPFDAFTEALRGRLAGALPGTTAQFTMAPAYRQNATLADTKGKNCREAGVLVLLFPLDEQPAVALTVRHAALRDHAGQVSFPGGRREPNETHLRAALREAEEEIGLDTTRLEILGALSPLYIPPSNYCVYPFVAAVYALPTLYPSRAEVEAVLKVPLAHLFAPENRRHEERLLNGMPVQVPFFAVGAYRVWGATAMMLAELLALVSADAQPGTR